MSESPKCYICHEDGKDIIKSPCKCDGSIGYVHKTCINTWINMNHTRICPNCKMEYPEIHKEFDTKYFIGDIKTYLKKSGSVCISCLLACISLILIVLSMYTFVMIITWVVCLILTATHVANNCLNMELFYASIPTFPILGIILLVIIFSPIILVTICVLGIGYCKKRYTKNTL